MWKDSLCILEEPSRSGRHDEWNHDDAVVSNAAPLFRETCVGATENSPREREFGIPSESTLCRILRVIRRTKIAEGASLKKVSGVA